VVENIIVNSEFVQEHDRNILFGDEPVHFTDAKDLPNLLVELKIFKSTSQARQANRKGSIPFGFTDEFKASKKSRIWIWNPSE